MSSSCADEKDRMDEVDGRGFFARFLMVNCGCRSSSASIAASLEPVAQRLFSEK